MKELRYANFLLDGAHSNEIFDTNSFRNRDNCLEPYNLLKKKFILHDIEINTPDINKGRKPLFELHMDVQSKVRTDIPSYVLLIESPQIRPANKNRKLLCKYKRVFTWNDDLVDGKYYIKLNLPNSIVVNASRGWKSRKKLICMIANNKTVPYYSSALLYGDRIKFVKWFERNAPEDFDLYGNGWESAPAIHGVIGRVISKLKHYMPELQKKVHFPSYRGIVESKLKTLSGYRFSICFENVCGLSGYITEKIFDCFFAGCVPIYWGASNISNYIPEDCFIDRRSFDSHEALYQFIVSMKEDVFINYQESIAAFLRTDQAKSFSADNFSETIVETIVDDLAITL